MSEIAKVASGRDPRIDFFRGVALLAIALNHAEQLAGIQVISFLTYAPVGITTGAEVFVFLSGLTLGFVYQRVYESRGYGLLHARALFRAWQLFVYHLFALVCCFAIVGLVSALLAPKTLAGVFSMQISNEYLLGFVTFSQNPVFFDILPLYITLLIVLPIWFVLLNRSLLVGLAASGTLYGVMQIAHWVGYTEHLSFFSGFYYNPLTWQLLFVIGLAIGISRFEVVPKLSRRQMIVAVAALVLVALWYKGVRLNALFGWFGDVAYVPGQGVPFDIPLTSKPLLGPFRLLHFLTLSLVIVQFLGPNPKLWQGLLFRPVIICGQHSLEVFVFGMIAAYAVGGIAGTQQLGRPGMVMLDVMVVGSSIALAYLLRWKDSTPWRAG